MAGGGRATVACCIRRERLTQLRNAAPGLAAGDAIDGWLRRECTGVREALNGAQRKGPWLSSGPLQPGVRVQLRDGVFRIGNAAGEAHPILGEGMSMALQSAALLCAHLLADGAAARSSDALFQAAVQRRYAQAWQAAFMPRLRLAAAFAHAAMRPLPGALLMATLRAWPGLLTRGARWGGKVQPGPVGPTERPLQSRPDMTDPARRHNLQSTP
jgi:flavin-dependent dehydrogenase